MADFNFKPSFSFLDNSDPTMDTLTQFTELNQGVFTDNFHGLFPFSNDNICNNNNNNNNQASDQIHGGWTENQFQGFSLQASASGVALQPIVTAKTEFNESKKRKTLDLSDSSSGNSSSAQVSENVIKLRRNNTRYGKRAKSINNKKEEEKPREVVHVRARRGQATDSHSLAERVRRGKINERLRCLQDIVPGCYKTMGMAVMLDEIINYVQSLQNQVEFLSMELTAASIYYDFNSESDNIEKMQRAKAQEAKELERLMRGGLACFHSSPTWSSLI